MVLTLRAKTAGHSWGKQNGHNSMSNELGLDDGLIEELIENSQTEQACSNDLPEGTRQILIVSNHHLFTAGFIDGKKTNSQTVVVLTGQPSPNSDSRLNKAYLRFVPDDALVPPPRYVASSGTVHIWLHHRNLETVLTQIHEGKVYCWIGHFANGHVYADVHTSH